jgi:hypothetical protein
MNACGCVQLACMLQVTQMPSQLSTRSSQVDLHVLLARAIPSCMQAKERDSNAIRAAILHCLHIGCLEIAAAWSAGLVCIGQQTPT